MQSVSRLALGCFLLGLGSACGADDSDPSTSGGASGSSATGGVANGGTSGGKAGTATGGSGPGAGGSSTGGGTSGGGGGGTSTLPAESFPVGFAAPEVLVPNLTRPVRIGFHAGHLYFTEMGLDDGTQSRLARRDPTGKVETLYAGNEVAALFLDEDELFFVERGARSVFRMKYATLQPVLFSSAPAATTTAALTVADVARLGEMIWLSQFSSDGRWTAVVTKSRDGDVIGEPLPAAQPGFIFTYMVAGGGQLYLATQGATPSGLYKVAASGTAGVTIRDVAPNRLATDATHVYFGSDSDGRILRQRHDEASNPEVVASGQNQPYAVAVDSGGIYWTNGPDCSEGQLASGSVMARALASGTPVPVATLEGCPQAIVTDTDYVYWIREKVSNVAGDDAIVRAKKLR